MIAALVGCKVYQLICKQNRILVQFPKKTIVVKSITDDDDDDDDDDEEEEKESQTNSCTQSLNPFTQ